LEDKVLYSAEDSMIISVSGKLLYLYGKASVKYTDVELTADYILLDLANKEVFARGTTDSSGTTTGSPAFKQGKEPIESDSMRYNFNSKKGIIFNIITKEGEGTFHSEKTKREENEEINAIHNKYTTCDAKHPHFYLAMSKALVIPEDKIVTGPAYLVVADVPLPLFIPFGFFPNTTKSASGILIPTYENGGEKGFGLRDGGWYQVLGEYADLVIRGNVYSRKSWGINPTLTYTWKYHFGGKFAFSYNENKRYDDPTYISKKDYSVNWNHSQDSKANPNQNISANVRFSSRENDRRNSYETSQYMESNTSSSISYSRSFPKSGANLSISANGTQNKQTRKTDISFPTGSFNLGTKYPFRKKEGSGKYKWYENISIGYRSIFDNNVNTYDSLLFTQQTLNKLQNGFKHDIPVALSLKIGKLITISPSLTYTGMVYSKHIDKRYEFPTDSTFKAVYDTVQEWSYIHAINPSASLSISPKIYGMYVSKKEGSYIVAVRHVLSPSVSVSFTPDMRKVNPNYYDTLFYTTKKDTVEKFEIYSRYRNEKYGVPSAYGKSGGLRFTLNNNLEMKVMPKNDTTGKPKKVVLLDNLNFSTGYNPFKDSIRWDNVSFSTGTKLFKNKIDIRVNGGLSPYALNDSTGIITNTFYLDKTGKFLRLTNVSVSSGISLRSDQGKKGDKKSTQNRTPNDQQNDALLNNDNMDIVPGTSTSGQYVDFDIPWSANMRYGWSYNKSGLKSNVSHTISIDGDFSLTPKWKVGFSTGYDLVAKKVTFTTLNFYRDLHCWEMSFSVVPFGQRASYSFRINAKSSLLQDLKYEEKPNTWYDNF
jgi:lipopolysaccharide assembly outer membrane protein LptD (OstA)